MVCIMYCMLHNMLHNIVYTMFCCMTWNTCFASSTVIPGISPAAGSGKSRSKAAISSATKPGKPSNTSIVANGSAPLSPPPPAPTVQPHLLGSHNHPSPSSCRNCYSGTPVDPPPCSDSEASGDGGRTTMRVARPATIHRSCVLTC